MTFKRAASTICALAMVAGMIGAQNVIGSASDNGTERDDLIPTSSQPGSSSSQGGGDSSSSQGGGDSSSSQGGGGSSSSSQGGGDSSSSSQGGGDSSSSSQGGGDSSSSSQGGGDSSSSSQGGSSSSSSQGGGDSSSSSQGGGDSSSSSQGGGDSSSSQGGGDSSSSSQGGGDSSSSQGGGDSSSSQGGGDSSSSQGGNDSQGGTDSRPSVPETKISIGSASISISGKTYTYTGSELTPPAVVSLNGKVLTPSRDYTLTYVNNINAGTAFVIVNGIGSYNGSAIGSFTIAPKTVTSAVLSVNGKKYTYTGKALKPTTTVKLGNVLLKKDIDYTIAYSNNKNTGRATVRITGVGNYKGSRTVYFYIKPKALAIKKVTSPAARKLKVTWTKDTQATGYQIVVATNSAFTKNKKTVTISKNTTVAKTLTGLKAGKKYYVRLRAYKLVGKTKYYGAYGAKKSIKVK